MEFVKIFMSREDAERAAHYLDWTWNVLACVSKDGNLICNLELFNDKFVYTDDPSSCWRNFFVYANDPENQSNSPVALSEWPDLNTHKPYGLVSYYANGGTPVVHETANNPQYLLDQLDEYWWEDTELLGKKILAVVQFHTGEILEYCGYFDTWYEEEEDEEEG